MTDIETSRLILRLVPLTGLAATAAKDRQAARHIIGMELPEAWFDEAWVSELRLKQWTEDPSYAPWSVRAIGLKDTGQIIGNMNCHHVPMPFMIAGETLLAVEMGYTIFEPWRRRGFVTEAIHGFTKWAVSKGLQALVLSIAPDNAASLKLAAKLGGEKIGSHVDEVDGPEDIYLVRV